MLELQLDRAMYGRAHARMNDLPVRSHGSHCRLVHLVPCGGVGLGVGLGMGAVQLLEGLMDGEAQQPEQAAGMARERCDMGCVPVLTCLSGLLWTSCGQ